MSSSNSQISHATDQVDEIALTKSRTAEADAKEVVNSMINGHADILFGTLRSQCKTIEDDIRSGEKEVLRKEEEAYCLGRNENELQKMKEQQRAEVKRKQEIFHNLVAQRAARKKAKVSRVEINFFDETNNQSITLTLKILPPPF